MLPSTLKYLYFVEPVRMHFPAKQPYCTNDTVCNAACRIAHSIICTRLFRGKIRSDWFNGIEILQGRWQHGEKVGYCYPSGLEKILCKWDIYVPLVMKGLTASFDMFSAGWWDYGPISRLHELYCTVGVSQYCRNVGKHTYGLDIFNSNLA